MDNQLEQENKELEMTQETPGESAPVHAEPQAMPQRAYAQEAAAQGQQARPQGVVQGQMGPRQPVRPGQPMNPQARPPYRQSQMQAQGMPPRRGNVPAGARPMNMPPARQELSGPQLAIASRGRIRSFLFVLIALLNAACIGGAIAGTLMQNLNFSDMLDVILKFDIPAELVQYVNMIKTLTSVAGSGIIVFGLLIQIPDILICLGFWTLIFTATKKKANMSGSGFLLTKIGLLLHMIGACILVLVCLVFSVAVTVTAWISGVQLNFILSCIVLVAMIIISMVVIMYFFCMLHTLKIVRKNARQGLAAGNVSRYAAVITILIALASIIGLLSAIVNMEIAGMVNFGGRIGWMIFLGFWIMAYRNKLGLEEE